MKKTLFLGLLLAAMAAVCQVAPPPSVEGIYRVNINAGQVWLTAKILPGAPRAQFVGVVLDSNMDWGRKQIGQVFLELNAGPGGRYTGRFRPQFTGNSNNLEEWWPLEGGVVDAQGHLTFSDVTATGRGTHTFQRVRFDAPVHGGEPPILGQYRWDAGSDYAVLEVRASTNPLYDLIGVMVDGSAGYRSYIGQVFFALNKVGVNGYHGRDSILGYITVAERVNVTESGDLRVQVESGQGEAVLIYHRYTGGAGAAAGASAQPGSGGGAGPGPGNPRTSAAGGSGAAAGGSATPLAMNPGAWQQAPNYVGPISAAQQGLFLQGGAFTNGRLVNGAYDGNRVQSRETIDLTSGGDIYAAFAVDGAGAYLVFWPRLLTGASVPAFTTDHSWNNSIQVPHRTWLFGHLRVERGGGYRFTLCTGGYDDHGGTPLGRSSGTLANPVGRVDFQFMDNYAGTRASLVIGEVWVVHDGATQPVPAPAAAPGTQRRPGGAQCSQPGECDSGICLLGVCAPKSR